MLQKKIFLFFCLMSFFANLFAETSIVGFWQTTDLVTKKPRAVIEITIGVQGQLIGKLVSINYRYDESVNDRCKNCTGKAFNQKILDLNLFNNVYQSNKSKSTWQGGTILDYKTGRKYNVVLHLSPDGKILNVRAYMYFAWLGKTQSWHRFKKFKPLHQNDY